VIVQVLPDAGEMRRDVDAEAAQRRSGTDAREHQQARRINRACGHDDAALGEQPCGEVVARRVVCLVGPGDEGRAVVGGELARRADVISQHVARCRNARHQRQVIHQRAAMLRIGEPLLIALRERRILLLIGIARFGRKLLGRQRRERREAEQQRVANDTGTRRSDGEHRNSDVVRSRGYGVGGTEERVASNE
jgi:hypothetical protein